MVWISTLADFAQFLDAGKLSAPGWISFNHHGIVTYAEVEA